MLTPSVSLSFFPPPAGTLTEPAGITQLRRDLVDKNRRLEETLLNLDNLISPLDWLDAGDGFPGFGSWRFNRPANRTQDRSHAPLNYISEEEWFLHVALARDLCTRNHLAIGFRDHVSNFIGPVAISFVLRGQSPGASAGGPDAHPLLKECMQLWDEWRELADWGMGEDDREDECRRRVIVEGEATLQFFPGDANSHGVPYVRQVEPELIRTPSGHSTLGRFGWGIITAERDDDSREGLWLCRPDNVNEGDSHPWSQFARIKGNVDRTIKRGLSDFFPVGELLRKILGLHENMAHVARLQAAIAWWEENPTATIEQVQNMIRAGADFERLKLAPTAAGARTDVTSYEAGTVVRTEAGRNAKPGPTATPNGFIQVDQVVLRGVGFRFGTPSYFTGEGADSFAGVLVTGSPFVRIIESRQERLKAFSCQVAMRVLEFAERTGRLPEGTCRQVRPVATARPVVIADEEKQARTFLSLYQQNCASPQEYMRKRGWDPKIVEADIQAWKKKFPDQGGEQNGGQPPATPSSGPTPAPPGSAGGDGTSPNKPDDSDTLGESLLVEDGKSGVFRDASGRRYRLDNGKRVPLGDSAPTPATRVTGTAASPPTDHTRRAAIAERRRRDSVAAEHIRATAQEPPQPKHLAIATRFKDVARRRRIVSALKTEAELAEAIHGFNEPDSRPADVLYLEDEFGKEITDPEQVKNAMRLREASVKILKTGKVHTIEHGKVIATDVDADEGHKRIAQQILARRAEAIEVKMLHTSPKHQVYMNPKAKRRKELYADRHFVPFHVVAVDRRRGQKHSGHQIYVAPYRDVSSDASGTVKLDQMKKVGDFAGVLGAVS